MTLLSNICSYLHMFESFIKKNITTGITVLDHDLPRQQTLPPHPRPLQLHSASKSQFYQDTSSETRADAVIPEAGVALLVLQPHQQHLLHQCQPGLLTVSVLHNDRSFDCCVVFVSLECTDCQNVQSILYSSKKLRMKLYLTCLYLHCSVYYCTYPVLLLLSLLLHLLRLLHLGLSPPLHESLASLHH